MGIGIVEDAPLRDDVGQVLMLNLVTNSHHCFLVFPKLGNREDLQRRCFDCLRNVDDFLKSGHTERHIL